ncbi:MAG: winged helix-turn-helix transcriptional regulator [Candidatus Thorarchaeota archaeon]|jgi:Lrp/AsnC family leucine-responsive transcriptional regulator
MDELDKSLLLRLLSNCRESYRRLAREMGVTCPTIKRRVDRLVENGVIENFTIDLSQETLGVGWAYAEITTDLSEVRADLIQKVCSHRSTKEIFAVGSKKYIAFAELAFPDGIYEYGKFLRGLDGVTQVDILPAKQLPTSQLSNRCKYTSRGKKFEFTNQHLKVMKHLVNKARISILDLSEKVGFKPKRERRILKELEEGEGVHFTIRFNPSAVNKISFMLKIKFDELDVSPSEIAYWIENEFPREHWISFLLLNEPVMINYMTIDSLSDIENIIRRMKEASFIKDVETMVIYHVEKPSDCGSLTSSEYLQLDSALAVQAVS